MKEHYVSYNQAVALKRLGFDWKCDRSYTDVIKESAREEWDEEECQWSTVYDCNYYPKPRLDQAAAWMREEKGVLVWATPDKQPIDDDYSDVELTGEWWWEVDGKVREASGDTYPSYESALSAGLDAALELLGKEVNNA